jgi:hypothetical protein
VPANSTVTATVERDRRIKVTTQTVIPAVSNAPSSTYSPAPTAPISSAVAISDNEFSEIKQSVEKISFSSTKLETAKNALKGKYVKSSQVAELVKLFAFESDKIELAKFCYDITLDKDRYYLVNDSFSFSSSIDELNTFIKNRN